MWAANKGLPTFYLLLFIATGAEKWDDTSKGFGLDFKFHSIQGFVDSLILDSDHFKKSVTNSSFQLQISSSLTQTHSMSGYTVLNHFTLNCLLHAAPHPDDWSLVAFDSGIHYLPLLCSHNCPSHSCPFCGNKGVLRGPADPSVMGCMPSTLHIHLLFSDIVFIKDSNPLVEGG